MQLRLHKRNTERTNATQSAQTQLRAHKRNSERTTAQAHNGDTLRTKAHGAQMRPYRTWQLISFVK